MAGRVIRAACGGLLLGLASLAAANPAQDMAVTIQANRLSVPEALYRLAELADMNLVLGGRIEGELSLRLDAVPWSQALALISELHDLEARIEGDVLVVSPLSRVTERLQARQTAIEAAAAGQPLETLLLRLNHADAGTLAAMLAGDPGGLLSPRGRISVDQRSNTLILHDLPDHLDQSRDILLQLDEPARQVMIEARIVIANSDFSQDLGVRLGAAMTRQTSRLLRIGGTAGAGLEAVGPGFAVDGRDGLLLDLPAAQGGFALGLSLSQLTERILQLELSAMELEGRGEVISSPRIVTADGHAASIRQGVDIPYQQANGDGGSNTAFQQALLSLDVTPRITPDNRIQITLEVTKDSVGQLFDGVPSIDTQALSTQVLVDDGATLVLGGILEQAQRRDRAAVPGLHRLPVLGRLFRRRSEQRSETELLVFVTPHIVGTGQAGDDRAWSHPTRVQYHGGNPEQPDGIP